MRGGNCCEGEGEGEAQGCVVLCWAGLCCAVLEVLWW